MSYLLRRRRAPTAQRPLVAHELLVDVEDKALKNRIRFKGRNTKLNNMATFGPGATTFGRLFLHKTSECSSVPLFS